MSTNRLVRLDGAKIHSKGALIREIYAQFSAADYASTTWDGLYDILSEDGLSHSVDIRNEKTLLDKLGSESEAFLEILSDLQAEYGWTVYRD